MEIMYWRFPHLNGAWSVAAGKPYRMVSNTFLGSIDVEWEDGIPINGTHKGLPIVDTSPKSAWDTQVGGNHYTKMKIQPFQFSMANDLDPMQHTIIKYVTRFRDKNGIEDLEKAKQTIDLLIAYEKEQKNATN